MPSYAHPDEYVSLCAFLFALALVELMNTYRKGKNDDILPKTQNSGDRVNG